MRLFLSLAAAAGLLLAPMTARAASTVKTVTYHTSYHQTQPMNTGGEYVGRMTLRFLPDGTVNGTYRDEFESGIHSVAGGVHGTSIWLSFGMRGHHQFNGSIGKGGVITGTLSNWHGPNVYKFTAVPATS